MLRRLAALTVTFLVPLALPAQSAVAGTHHVRVTYDCTHSAIRPERITLACTDEQFVLTQIQYSGWNTKRATGTDRTYSNQCQPNCTSGLPRYHHDRFVFDCPVHTNGYWFFTRARIYRNGALYVTWPLQTRRGQWGHASYGKKPPLCQSFG
jgi:hypothetical protein